jgi:hypothetical protein
MPELPRQSNSGGWLSEPVYKPTVAQRNALAAVRVGLVQIATDGRSYPSNVNGRALTAAYEHGLWRWPGPYAPAPGDVAVLTSRGEAALDA